MSFPKLRSLCSSHLVFIGPSPSARTFGALPPSRASPSTCTIAWRSALQHRRSTRFQPVDQAKFISDASSLSSTSASKLANPQSPSTSRLHRLLRRTPRFPSALRRPQLPPYSKTIFFLLFVLSSAAAYELLPPARHLAQGILRSTRLMYAVILDAIDYKRTFARAFVSDVERRDAYAACHKRSAERLLSALEDLGGIFIKLGQHLSSVAVIPIEWSETMSVLQDRCPQSSPRDIDAMLLRDTGKTKEVFFSDWDPNPIGTASIAQVHLATDRETGERVAVKLQHPHLEEFLNADLATVNFAVALIDRLFPEFEFGWLALEINENLPLEMDFRIEAKNAARVTSDFAHFERCSLYVPTVHWVEKRILVMEYIEGARVDNLDYLDRHQIDRNLVSKELSRIFSQMVYLNGFFHADPHQGNVLIRPRPSSSRSPHNFEVVLLDHGQYFDLDDVLRVNYARFWLSLISPNSAKVQAERRKYAALVGNVGPDLYPILESALTGRIGLARDEPEDDATSGPEPFRKMKAGSMAEVLDADEDEKDHMRNAIIEREGLFRDILRMLRNVPRRITIVIKLNDLTRSLDRSLETTHGQARVFMIVARYCAEAVYLDTLSALRSAYAVNGLSLSLMWSFVASWTHHLVWTSGLQFVEAKADARGAWVAWQRRGSRRVQEAQLLALRS